MRSLSRMPWQDRIAEANDKIVTTGGIGHGKKSSAEIATDKKLIFEMAQIPGTIAMFEGGLGAGPLRILIQTENGWLVRLDLDAGAARKLAAAILTHAGDE